MDKEFVTKDSGERKEFPSGMRRDTDKGKPRYDLIWRPILKRWALLMGRGAEKYTANNWQKANSKEEMDRFKASAFRHFMDWINDENNEEDHAVAIFFNVTAVEFLKEKLSKDNYKKIIPKFKWYGEPIVNNQGSLFKVTPEEYELNMEQKDEN
jgi:hypothetical protein